METQTNQRRIRFPRRFRRGAGAVVAAAVLTAACDNDPGLRLASQLDATVAVAWFDLLVTLIRDLKVPPPPASRIYGHAAIAAYESIVPGTRSRQSLSGQVRGLGAMPEATGAKDYDWPSVVSAALEATIRGLLPSPTADVLARIDDLAQRTSADRAAATDQATVDRSADLGQQIAEVVLARAANDGFATFNNCSYTAPTGFGRWVPTPPAFAAPLQPCWGQLTQMVLDNPATCTIPPGNPFSTSAGSAHYGQMFEVYDTLNKLTDDQLFIANYWADNPGITGTPPGHWVSIVGDHVTANGLMLDVAVEAYARVGIAVNDAFISCWHSKYTYHTMRPVTYITSFIDPDWPLPPVTTPPFPDYPSGHSLQSGAASVVLADQFGEVSFTDTAHVDRGLPPQTYASFSEAADEAAISRLYGGIHYRDSIDLGVDAGRCIGQRIVESVQFFR